MPSYWLTADVGLDVRDTWRGYLLVSDIYGVSVAADTVTVTVTLPSGGTGTGTATAQPTIGLYALDYAVVEAGRHTIVVDVASAEHGDDVHGMTFDAYTTTGTAVDASAVRAYLGDTSATDEEITDALAAERAAQARRCVIPPDYPDDLAQALKRRVARNLAARSVPVASYTSFEGGGTSVRVPKTDAEVARLEAPYRKLPVA